MTQHAVMEDRWARYRPSPHVLGVMLRASAVDDGKGGPWLTLTRAHDNPNVFMHHISAAPTAFSPHQVVMCSGVELLGKFCTITHRVPANITAPDGIELRKLGDWCVERTDVELWDTDLQAWYRKYMGPAAKDRRAREADDGASRVRSLRWLMAEEWLR